MTTLELVNELKQTDNPRLAMLSILNASKVPPMVRVMGYGYLTNAKDTDISKLKELFIKAVSYIEANDTDGLKNFLQSMGIPGEIIKLVETYVANSSKD